MESWWEAQRALVPQTAASLSWVGPIALLPSGFSLSGFCNCMLTTPPLLWKSRTALSAVTSCKCSAFRDVRLGFGSSLCPEALSKRKGRKNTEGLKLPKHCRGEGELVGKLQRVCAGRTPSQSGLLPPSTGQLVTGAWELSWGGCPHPVSPHSQTQSPTLIWRAFLGSES